MDNNLEILNMQFGLDDINFDNSADLGKLKESEESTILQETAEELTEETTEVTAAINDESDLLESLLTETDLSESTEIISKAAVQLPKKDDDRTDVLDVYDVLQCVFVAIVTGILIFLLAGRVVGVEGSSMFPTLHEGDRLIVSNLLFDPSYGDIVILKSESYDHALVKRVIATEGQTIDIDFENGVVYVDKMAIHEPYIYEKTYTSEGFEGPVTVPEGCVFVMGDNRNDSSDSRRASIGFVDERQIIGKAYLLIFPGVDSDKTRDWSRIGSVY